MLRRYYGKIGRLPLNIFVGHDGELVVDDETGRTYVMDGVTPGGHELIGATLLTSNVPPPLPTSGTLWYDPTDGRLFVFFENTWVDASPDSKYTLPVANTATLGGVKIDNATIVIDVNGVITANVAAFSHYSNSNVASYLPTDSTITSLIANAAIQSANLLALYSNASTQAGLISLINANISAANANAGIQANSITSLYSNAATQANLISLINANVSAANAAIAALNVGSSTYSNSNVTAYLPTDSNIITLYANAATQSGLIALINSNINSANSAISILTANAASQANDITILYSNAATQTNLLAGINSNVTAANSAISTLNSNINAYESFANIWFGNLQSNINSQANDIITLYSNAGVQANSLTSLNNSMLTLSAVVASINAGTGFANTAQITAANAAISTLQANAATQSIDIANLYANAGTQATQINVINANITAANSSIISVTNYANSLNSAMTANITAANAAISTLTSNAASQANDITILYSNAATQASNLATLTSNASSQATDITTLYSNAAVQANILNTLTSNVSSLNTTVVNLIGGAFAYSNSNVATFLSFYTGNLTAGNVTISGNLSVLGNITSVNYETVSLTEYANSIIASGNVTAPNYFFSNGVSILANLSSNITNINANVSSANSAISTINANVSSANIVIAGHTTSINTINANILAANSVIATKTTYANSNVAAYLPTYAGNSNAAFFTGNGYYLTGITMGSSTYSNTDVSGYLPIYSGNSNAAFFTGNGYYLTGITGGSSNYSNSNVAAYLVTYNGNLSAGNLSLSSGASGNISGTGYVIAGNMIANTNMYANSYYWYNNNAPLATTIPGTYSNANVASYLPTYTGNVNVGNILLTANGNILAGTSTNMNIRTYGVYNVLTLYGIAGGYNSPPYTNQSLTGGSGSGMLASYSSTGGYITTITVTNPGTGYKNGDVLTVPGGLGSTVILSNYNPNVVSSKAYYWSFSQYDGNVTVPGNIVMPSNSYVLGDFTNSTFAYRTAFQTLTANSTTGIYALPSGTSTGASWQALNSSNANNASKIFMATNANTDVQLGSGINGSGVYLPLSFYNSNAAQMVIYPNGNVYMSNANPITTTGNISANYFVGNGSALVGIQANLQSGNIYGTSSNVTLVAGSYSFLFDNTGNLTIPTNGNIQLPNANSVINMSGNINAGNVIVTGASGPRTRFLWDTWQANSNASVSSFSPAGTVGGYASWDPSQVNGLKLTPNSNSVNGYINWNSGTVNYNYDMTITASLGAGGGTGADGQWIYFGANAAAQSNPNTNNTSGGIAVMNHFYSSANQFEVYVAGTQYNIPYTGSGNYITSGVTLWNASYNSFYNMTVMIRRIQNGNRMLEVYLNDIYQGSVNISSWTPAGNYFGVGGYTSGSNANLWVRQIRIDW